MNSTAKYLLLFFTLLSIKGFSQIKFYAETPNKTIGKNEYLQLNFTVENANKVDEITPPSFKNFQLVSGPNQQSSMTSYNGNIKRTISLGYILKPLGTGTFTIGPATATADGHEYHSVPITIKITNSASTSSNNNKAFSPFPNLSIDDLVAPTTNEYDDYILKKGEKIEDKINKNLFVRLEVTKKSCYVGEPIVATYKLYSRLKSESNIIKSPSFNGFSVSELGKPNNAPSTEKYNGREYLVYILRKTELYPLQPGQISLESMEVENKISFIKDDPGRSNMYDMMRDFADDNGGAANVVTKDVTLKNDPITITVLPLPAENKSASFKGAVGDFKITSSLEKNEISTNDVGNLIVKLEGDGNIQMINAPHVNFPKGVELFESSTQEEIDKQSVPMKGSKKFIFPFSVSSAGSLTIPSIEFSFFDLSKNAFRTISTEPLTVQVKTGFNTKSTKGQGKNYISKNTPGEIKWVLISGAALFLILVIWLGKRKAKHKEPESPVTTENNTEPEKIISKHPLSEVEGVFYTEDNHLFYSVLNRCLINYLAEKLAVPTDGLTKKRIMELLDIHNVNIRTSLLLSSLLENIEVSLYAPVTRGDRKQSDYENAIEIIALLEKEMSQASVNL
jgi:hypothetical protein